MRLMLASWLLVLTACTATWADADTPPVSPAYGVWQLWEAATGQPVAFEPWLDRLASADVIYLGEEHRNRFHIEAAVKILEGLLARERRPTLALEMFSWDGQDGLNRYLADRELPESQFLEASRWRENWGGPFADYAPLLAFAREQRIAALALNPPRALVRLVATDGLNKALPDPEMARWDMRGESFVDDPDYRARIVDPLRRCHGGMPDDGYERMYEASLFRDEGMAKTIAAALASGPAKRLIVSYTGGGHVQYRVPVPNRVQRRIASARQITVYLIAYEPGRADEIRQLLHERIADYVWLTPLSAHGPPRRCK